MGGGKNAYFLKRKKKKNEKSVGSQKVDILVEGGGGLHADCRREQGNGANSKKAILYLVSHKIERRRCITGHRTGS